MAILVRRLVLFASLTLLVGCDHATKGIAKATLEGTVPRELIGGLLDLRYVENTDIAFNLLRWVPEEIRTPGLLATGAIAVLALTVLLVRLRGEVRLAKIALVLVTAGAIGNYLDRLARGYVVDFVHVHHWPVFNVADVYITFGFGLLAGLHFFHRRSPSHPAVHPPQTPSGSVG